MTERPQFVTVGSTVSAADNIIEWLKPQLQGDTPDRVKMVERHIGSFDKPDDVKRYLSGQSGCVRLAALRIRDISNRNGMTGLVTWAAYVMATDSYGYSRDARCQVLVGAISRRISSRDAAGGMKAERIAQNITAENLYSGKLDDFGLCIWAVTWEQEFRLDDEIDLSALPDFLRLGATYSGSGQAQEIINVKEGQANE